MNTATASLPAHATLADLAATLVALANGRGGTLLLSLEDVSVGINTSSRTGFIADLSKDGAGNDWDGYSIETGGEPVLLNYDNAIIEASVGNAYANVAGILTLQGGFAFQKRTLDAVNYVIPGVTDITAPGDALIIAPPFIMDDKHLDEIVSKLRTVLMGL